jgi:hypothetical protein
METTCFLGWSSKKCPKSFPLAWENPVVADLRGIAGIGLSDAISIGLIRIDALLDDAEMRHPSPVGRRSHVELWNGGSEKSRILS